MRLKAYSLLVSLVIVVTASNAQFSLSGTVTDDEGVPLNAVELYLKPTGDFLLSDTYGVYRFENIDAGTYTLVAFSYGFKVSEQKVDIQQNVVIDVQLQSLGEELSEVILIQEREKVFALQNLRKVEGTAIYAGKNTEVVAVDLLTANLASNVARQIYGQVVGLNIYDGGAGGLQLNIGGRGLDPNRSANFNVRQNGYDISADVLGYPESYYTPPVEALSEIQVVRGAASLQYGTQFGGLINFKFKPPNPNKKFEFVSRQTVGSYNLFTSFNSASGTIGKFSYYNYFNYKSGEGFRPNTNFNSRNYHGHFGYQISNKTKIWFEATILDYLAQQPGGLTDAQFEEDPSVSLRERNWFDVSWLLGNMRLEHRFSSATEFSLNIFGLDASRSALGFRENRVLNVDPGEERELLIDDFQNWGAEARLLTRYKIGQQDAVALIGSKYYQSYNLQRQGAGPASFGPDFRFVDEEFPTFPRRSSYTFPNLNIAVFGEHIFNITDRLSITPGFRFEYIKTQAVGNFTRVFVDLAGNLINTLITEEDRVNERSFVLLGVGAAYKLGEDTELYANFSENYRSITFNDIRVVNPAQIISEDLEDESGFTADLGVRGTIDDLLRYDVSTFALYYANRISANNQIVDEFNQVRNITDNVGTALILGLETVVDVNLKPVLFPSDSNVKLNMFINSALTTSEYIKSDLNNSVDGKRVEHIPNVNIRTGLRFGIKNFLASFQYSYLSEQFNDPLNSTPFTDSTAPNAGIIGTLPAYDVMDLSLSYTYKNWRLEAGVNNLLDESYFTRRATGYPGPGIIPAEPRTFYTTLQFKL